MTQKGGRYETIDSHGRRVHPFIHVDINLSSELKA